MTDFNWPLRVYYEDTDAGGVVYHANYLRFFERARTEWLRQLGYSQAQLAREQDLLFAVVDLQVQFHAPARLDDVLRVRSQVRLAGGASVVFTQELWRDAGAPQRLASATVRVACLQPGSLRPRRLPDTLREELS
mgnify:CR=1 FL=1